MSKQDTVILSEKYKEALAKNKVTFPVCVTEKYDGVLARAVKVGDKIKIYSRQNNEILSVQHLNKELENLPLISDSTLIGELYQPNTNFKDISGRVRRQSEQYPECEFKVFDLITPELADKPYKNRLSDLYYMFDNIKSNKISLVSISRETFLIAMCNTPEAVMDTYNNFMKANPDAEGVVIRLLNGKNSVYKIGRSYGLLKLIPEETVDLKVVSLIEGTGNCLGMITAILVNYKGVDVKVSTSSIPHAERVKMFNNQSDYVGKMMEVKYKTITPAGSLREPVFKRWRPDRDD